MPETENNYRGFKLLGQILKVTERVILQAIRKRVNREEMQFGFCTRKKYYQQQERSISTKKNWCRWHLLTWIKLLTGSLILSSGDCSRSQWVDERLMRAIQAMNRDVAGKVNVCIDKINQGLVISSLVHHSSPSHNRSQKLVGCGSSSILINLFLQLDLE